MRKFQHLSEEEKRKAIYQAYELIIVNIAYEDSDSIFFTIDKKINNLIKLEINKASKDGCPFLAHKYIDDNSEIKNHLMTHAESEARRAWYPDKDEIVISLMSDTISAPFITYGDFN